MKIRRKILNMSYDMWIRLDGFYKIESDKADEFEFETTPEEFLNNIGLPSSLSAYCNEIENEFFKKIYELERLNRNYETQKR